MDCAFLDRLVSDRAKGFKFEELEESASDGEDFIEDVVEDGAEIIIPAVEEYHERQKRTHDAFRDVVEDYAIGQLGCDPECVNDCTN